MTAAALRLRWRGRLTSHDWPDLALLVTGVVVLAVAASFIQRHSVSAGETDVFRAINDHTVVPNFVVWPIMQLGNFLVIPAATLVAVVFRRWRLAISLLVAGLAAYFIAADVIRRIIIRGRPNSLLADVHERGAAAHGLGFVSGHTAVATALVVVAWPCLNRVWRVVVVTTAVLVGLARIYVGAHFPLDVIGGAALGLAIGGAVRLLLGRSERTTGATPANTIADSRRG